MNKYSIAYIRDGGLERLTKEDALKLTHINLAFGKINDGKVYTKLKNLHLVGKIKEYNPKIKFLISLGGWGNGGFSEAASNSDNRKLFNDTAIELMRNNNLDGLDIDWEFPCSSVSGISSSSNDKENFTIMLKELREALNEIGKVDNKYYMLTIAAGADQYFIDGTNMADAEKYLDYIMLMTYDLRGGFQILTGHHTPLYNTTGDLFRISTDSSVKSFIAAGVPKEKLIIGAAFYSRQWTNVPNVNNGLLQMTPGAGLAGPEYTELAKDYINKNGYIRYWDDEAKAPYLFNGSTFISYDDSKSILEKVKYIKDNNLLGLMFWLYDADKTGELLNAVCKVLE